MGMSMDRAWFPPLACRELSMLHVRQCMAVVFFTVCVENLRRERKGVDAARPQVLWPRLSGLRWLHSVFAGLEHLMFPELASSSLMMTNAKV